MKLVYEYFCISLWFWLRENLWLSPRKKGKRKNTRVPALDEISINVAQSRARHPVINPTLLSQFLATSLPPSPFHLYERLGKGGEREREIDRNFFFFSAGEKTKTWRRNRDNRRKPTRFLFQAERDGEGMDGWIRG